MNRREFERRLAELIETAGTQRREHALLFMDLDNFKAVNDTCGHSAGDELLRQLTSIMLTRMRGSDTLARLGGDEFGALLESCPIDQALRIANGLRETVREFRFVWEGKTFSVGVSVGLVPIDAASGDVNQVLATADACCYDAKNRGRDRVQVYRPEEPSRSGRREELQLVSQINRAFELGKFRLYRQRIAPLDPAPRRELHYEVLVRMVDRDGNLVPATAFMPAAERYNLLTSIERWVVSSLVEFLHRQWTAGAIPHDLHGSGERGFYSVNISGASINDKSFPDFLRNLLTRYQLPSGLLCFEITETTAISNLSKAAELMHELKGMGCRFALDDFGTGMSSFAYLKYLPVDFLKIAGVFIKDMVHRPDGLRHRGFDQPHQPHPGHAHGGRIRGGRRDAGAHHRTRARLRAGLLRRGARSPGGRAGAAADRVVCMSAASDEAALPACGGRRRHQGRRSRSRPPGVPGRRSWRTASMRARNSAVCSRSSRISSSSRRWRGTEEPLRPPVFRWRDRSRRTAQR